MSSRKGEAKKKGQAHQNHTKFVHNTKSKLSAKLSCSPLDFLCQRCMDIVKWRLQYRKYKPLTKPRTCNCCGQKNIGKAYRTVCEPCAKKGKICTKCGQSTKTYAEYTLPAAHLEKLEQQLQHEMDDALQSLKERCKRTVLRKVENGEVTYDKVKKIFVYKDTEEEYKLQTKGEGQVDSDEDSGNSDDDIDEDEDESDSDDQASQKGKAKAAEAAKESQGVTDNKKIDQIAPKSDEKVIDQ